LRRAAGGFSILRRPTGEVLRIGNPARARERCRAAGDGEPSGPPIARNAR
jgi:hypothetical protein